MLVVGNRITSPLQSECSNTSGKPPTPGGMMLARLRAMQLRFNGFDVISCSGGDVFGLSIF